MRRRVLKSWSVDRTALNKGWVPPMIDETLRLVGVVDGTRMNSIEVVYEFVVDFPEEVQKT